MLLFAPYKKETKNFFWKVNKISSERFQKIFAWCNVWAPKNNDNKKVHLNCRQTNTHKKFSKPSCVSHIENFCKYFFGIYKKLQENSARTVKIQLTKQKAQALSTRSKKRRSKFGGWGQRTSYLQKTPEKDITASTTPVTRRALSLTTEEIMGKDFSLKLRLTHQKSTIAEQAFTNTGPRAHKKFQTPKNVQ